MSEREPQANLGQQAIDIFTATHATLTELSRQRENLKTAACEQALTEELGHFALANLDNADVITSIDRYDDLDAHVNRYATAYANDVMIRETFAVVVAQRNKELKELLRDKTLKVSLLPNVKPPKAFSMLGNGSTRSLPKSRAGTQRMTGVMKYVDSNVSRIHLLTDKPADDYEVHDLGIGSPITWEVSVMDLDGRQLVDLTVLD